MKVTDKQYYMDDKLIGKLDLMIKRSSGKSKLDNWIVIDGDEGFGKSTMSVCCAYYMAQKLKRPFGVEQIFFDPDKFIEYGTKTKEQVLILDESVFGGLSGDAMTKIGKKLIKFSMVIRKKKHVVFLNIPKFFKLNEYLMVDRAVALIHVYARGGTKLGRFVYFTNTQKEKLFYGYKKSRIRKYKTLYTLRGTFPDALGLLINEKEYDKKKDEAILLFGAMDNKTKDEFIIDKIRIHEEFKKKYGIKSTQIDDSKSLGIHRNTYGILLRKLKDSHDATAKYSIIRDISKENDMERKKEKVLRNRPNIT